jgi:hypothetical protein
MLGMVGIDPANGERSAMRGTAGIDETNGGYPEE